MNVVAVPVPVQYLIKKDLLRITTQRYQYGTLASFVVTSLLHTGELYAAFVLDFVDPEVLDGARPLQHLLQLA